MPSDTPEGLTPREALDRLAALDAEGIIQERSLAEGAQRLYAIQVAEVTLSVVRGVLAEVSPEPGGDMQSPLARPGDMQSSGRGSYKSGGVLDRDQARDLIYAVRDGFAPAEDALDALAGCVRPAAIDRDALAWRISDVLMRVYDNGTSPNARREAEEVVNAIEDDLAVRPVAGVTLTPEEATYARRWLPTANSQRARDLAARLEAGS